MTHGAIEPIDLEVHVDDCWNRIGVRGDSSCPKLADYARCLNCPVFAQAAARLLDRPLTESDLAPSAAATPVTERATETESALIFRIADEWLALPTTALHHVDDIRPIHSLPHRRNRIVLGLVNVRGALTVAASLGELLNLDRTASGKYAANSGYPRMLIAAYRGETVALPVDEVDGVARFAADALLPVPTTLAHAGASHARGLLVWKARSVGLLDTERVFEALARSLR
jgi:chemotaxis-related protein WspD